MTKKYCQYIKSNCDEFFTIQGQKKGFFIYPTKPVIISRTMSSAVRELQKHSSKEAWQSWEDLSTTGQIIFCKICEAIKNADIIIANITTLNFNVLFEIGYSIGLQKPVVPVRDTSYQQDKELFEELGIFDVLGYEDFRNSQQLRKIVTKENAHKPIRTTLHSIDKEQPTYLLKSPYDSDGSVKLLSSLKKSALYRFRTYDPKETPRISLYEAVKQVSQSVAIVAHLIDNERKGAQSHNALCAFISGMAMAMSKHVLMLQEGHMIHPIDYRDAITPYSEASEIPRILEKFVRVVSESLYYSEDEATPTKKGLLEEIDIGDVAAENEIRALHRYLVKTPQYQQARRGHAHLVVGRKGSGKTAIFYGVRNDVSINKKALVLDLKPEGHQFSRLREMVIDQLAEGLQIHTLTSFWSYLLLLEIAKKVVDKYSKNAWQSPQSLTEYQKLLIEYEKHQYDPDGDFSERILSLVDRIVQCYPKYQEKKIKISDITEIVYQADIKPLSDLVVNYLQQGNEVWLLFDNIDKGWSIKGATTADIAIVRSLLNATRKLQRQFESRKIKFNNIVFLRKDICDLLIDQTPDRGKVTVANLDWSDPILLEELLKKRFSTHSAFANSSFRDIWSKLFVAHVGGDDSFRYMLERSFLQPRTLLNFVTKCMQTAISREHPRVLEDDIKFAEIGFSEDIFNNLKYEIRDVYPAYPKLLQAFIGKEAYLSIDDIELIFLEADMDDAPCSELIDVLLWFSFLGIYVDDDTKYSYQHSYDIEKLKAYIDEKNSIKQFYIHPAFHYSLDIKKL